MYTSDVGQPINRGANPSQGYGAPQGYGAGASQQMPGRTINISQLAGGQMIRGDFNADGQEDILILGTPNQQTGAAPQRCNAGQPTVYNTQDLGVEETGRTVVSTSRGNVKLIKEDDQEMTITCPKTEMISYKVRVPVKKQRTIQVPVQKKSWQMETKSVPFQREITEDKYVLENQEFMVNEPKTTHVQQIVTRQKPVQKWRTWTEEIRVPRQVKVSKAVTEVKLEPFSTYETRTRYVPQRIAIPTYTPACDDTNVIKPTINTGSMPGGGAQGGGMPMSIPINRLSGNQVIRGDFNNDGVQDKIIMGGGRASDKRSSRGNRSRASRGSRR